MYPSNFKTKLALAAIKEEETAIQIVSRFGVHTSGKTLERSSCIGGLEARKLFTNWSSVNDVVDLVEPMGSIDIERPLKKGLQFGIFELKLTNKTA